MNVSGYESAPERRRSNQVRFTVEEPIYSRASEEIKRSGSQNDLEDSRSEFDELRGRRSLDILPSPSSSSGSLQSHERAHGVFGVRPWGIKLGQSSIPKSEHIHGLAESRKGMFPKY